MRAITSGGKTNPPQQHPWAVAAKDARAIDRPQQHPWAVAAKDARAIDRAYIFEVAAREAAAATTKTTKAIGRAVAATFMSSSSTTTKLMKNMFQLLVPSGYLIWTTWETRV